MAGDAGRVLAVLQVHYAGTAGAAVPGELGSPAAHNARLGRHRPQGTLKRIKINTATG